MKIIFLCLLLITGTQVSAQNQSNSSHFEGSIIYSFELSGDMAGMLQTFLPESMTFRFKNSDMAMSIEGGVMAKMGDILFLGEKNEAYMIDRPNKKVMKISPKSKDFKPSAPVVVKEAEVISIAGFPCHKYKVATRDKEGNAKISYLWATEKLTLKNNGSSDGASDQFRNFTIKGVKGIPLKMVNTQANLGTVTLTAIRVNPELLPDSNFSIPTGFSVEEFDPMKAGFR